MRRSYHMPTRVLPSLIAALAAWSLLAGSNDSVVKVGSSQVDGSRVRPSASTWYFAVRPSADAEWNRQGTISEEVSKGREQGRDVLIRKQVIKNEGNGTESVDTTVFDPRTLRPFHWSFTRSGEKLPPNAPAAGQLKFDGRKVHGEFSTASGQTKPVTAEGPMEMFDAGILGLIIASLPLKEGFEAEIPAVFRGQQKYMIRARVVGDKTFKDKRGRNVRAWAVKTDWKGLGTSDPYPDDDSGGTYYIVPDPPEGFPQVPKYISSNFDTEVIFP